MNKRNNSLVVFLLLVSCGYKIFGVITTSDMTMLLVAGFTVCKNNFEVSRKLLWFLIFFTLIMPTLSLGVNATNEIEFLKSLLQLFLYVFSAGMVMSYYLKRLELSEIETAYVKFGLVSSLLVLVQWYVYFFYDINIFSYISTWGGKSSWIENYIRIAGLTLHYNQLAIILCPPFVMSLEKKKVAVSVIIFIALLCSGSRIGLACALFSVYIYLLKHGKVTLFLTLSIIGFMAISYLATTDIFIKRFSFLISGELDGSTLQRFDLWRAALELYREHWVFGVGPGQYRDILKVDNVESGVIDILLNYGVVGVLCFIFIIIRSIPVGFRDELFGFKFSMLLVFIQNMVQPFLFMSIIGSLFWLLFMTIFLHKNEGKSSQSKSKICQICSGTELNA
ncbi:O-antigen ligase family protein [Pseudaeromonas sp. ZJS20]|uniref:O-antigen ligase family protein n=1 Tax=Pseudaeromonas aegiceratis TaxID=3153928 RepID=UPI00390C6954